MTANTNNWYLEGIKSRNSEVVQAIFSEYLPMITSFVKNNGGNTEDAQDIFMDALEAILRKSMTDGIILTCSFSTFLFEICKRQWYKKFRRKKFEAGVTIDDPKVSNIVQELEEPLDITERLKLMREKLQILAEDCRKILHLSWNTEMSMEEIAAEIGVTYAYVRKRKTKCKEKLVNAIKSDHRYAELQYH